MIGGASIVSSDLTALFTRFNPKSSVSELDPPAGASAMSTGNAPDSVSTINENASRVNLAVPSVKESASREKYPEVKSMEPYIHKSRYRLLYLRHKAAIRADLPTKIPSSGEALALRLRVLHICLPGICTRSLFFLLDSITEPKICGHIIASKFWPDMLASNTHISREWS